MQNFKQIKNERILQIKSTYNHLQKGNGSIQFLTIE